MTSLFKFGYSSRPGRVLISKMEVVSEGPLESQEQLIELAERYRTVVVPDDDDQDVNHWWVVRDRGEETLYVGNPGTFALFVQERTGGIQ
jgi:hypothetical protein